MMKLDPYINVDPCICEPDSARWSVRYGRWRWNRPWPWSLASDSFAPRWLSVTTSLQVSLSPDVLEERRGDYLGATIQSQSYTSPTLSKSVLFRRWKATISRSLKLVAWLRYRISTTSGSDSLSQRAESSRERARSAPTRHFYLAAAGERN